MPEKNWSEKNLDFIVANDVTRPDAGFGTDTTRSGSYILRGNKRPSPGFKGRGLALYSG